MIPRNSLATIDCMRRWLAAGDGGARPQGAQKHHVLPSQRYCRAAQDGRDGIHRRNNCSSRPAALRDEAARPAAPTKSP